MQIKNRYPRHEWNFRVIVSALIIVSCLASIVLPFYDKNGQALYFIGVAIILRGYIFILDKAKAKSQG
jgi:hypothetical protein